VVPVSLRLGIRQPDDTSKTLARTKRLSRKAFVVDMSVDQVRSVLWGQVRQARRGRQDATKGGRLFEASAWSWVGIGLVSLRYRRTDDPLKFSLYPLVARDVFGLRSVGYGFRKERREAQAYCRLNFLTKPSQAKRP
jgi:hypothetical protein